MQCLANEQSETSKTPDISNTKTKRQLKEARIVKSSLGSSIRHAKIVQQNKPEILKKKKSTFLESDFKSESLLPPKEKLSRRQARRRHAKLRELRRRSNHCPSYDGSSCEYERRTGILGSCCYLHERPYKGVHNFEASHCVGKTHNFDLNRSRQLNEQQESKMQNFPTQALHLQTLQPSSVELTNCFQYPRKYGCSTWAPRISFLSPSHLHIDNLCMMKPCTLARLSRCMLHAYAGLPNFSTVVWETVQFQIKRLARGGKEPFVWLVSDYRFGNYVLADNHSQSNWKRPISVSANCDDDIPAACGQEKHCSNMKSMASSQKIKIDKIDGPIFNPVSRCPPRIFSVSRKHCTNDSDLKQVQRCLRAIDAVINALPSTRLVFWCLAYRETQSKRHKHGGNFGQGAYARVRERYSHGDNFIDIMQFARRRGLSMNDLVRDNGGHPNDLGIEVLLDAIGHHEKYIWQKAQNNNRSCGGHVVPQAITITKQSTASHSLNSPDVRGLKKYQVKDCTSPYQNRGRLHKCCECTCILSSKYCDIMSASTKFVLRMALGIYHICVKTIICRLQKHMAIVRPRQTLRLVTFLGCFRSMAKILNGTTFAVSSKNACMRITDFNLRDIEFKEGTILSYGLHRC